MSLPRRPNGIRRGTSGPLGLLVLASALLLSSACGGAGEAGSAGHDGIDSVLLITLDTLRADHVSCYGDSPVETPHLDGLAERGVRVANAWSTAPLTTPGHASVLTGLHPPSHGVRNNGRARLPDSVTTLAELMKDSGRHTGAFVAAFTTSRLFGLAQGFDTYDDDLGHDRRGSSRTQRPGDEVLAEAEPWLERHADEPFFAWVHFFDPHTPYAPPPEYARQHSRNLYRGEVAFTDSLVGRLVDKLDELGVTDNTLVVAVADHGEGLGTHGEAEHGVLVYEETIKVPFLMVAPGMIEPGTTIEPPASVVDVLPTICAQLGIEYPSEVQGRNLLADGPSEPRPVIAETLYPHEEFGWSALYTIREDHLKYIHSTKPELYDLEQDPKEGQNLIDEMPERAAEMLDELERLEAKLRREDRLAPASGLGDEMDDATVARLESLGYMAGGGGGEEAATGDGEPAEILIGVSGRTPREGTTDLFRLDRAGQLMGRGHVESGLNLLRKIAENDPDNPQFLLKLAQGLEIADETKEAERTFQLVIERHPTFFLGYLRYARFLMNQERPAEARDLWLDLQEDMPRFVGIAPRLAEAEIEAGQPERAAERLEEHLAVQGDDPLAWAQLGRAHALSGNPDDAERAYRQALSIQPTQSQAAEGLVSLLEDQDRVQAARTTLEGLLLQAPEDPVLQNLKRELDEETAAGS
jgi:arylsulfatase A-like enzyme/Flp pilus assembly protein TadD